MPSLRLTEGQRASFESDAFFWVPLFVFSVCVYKAAVGPNQFEAMRKSTGTDFDLETQEPLFAAVKLGFNPMLLLQMVGTQTLY